ncbi:hypothetical protein, partial [Pseudomonas syringae]|uniref:hypothetical protein n=1 Tax=Pseudomonas syringae TaxID=317 RepID=UPI0019D70474
LTVLGLVLLALIAVYWLLQTVAGRDVLLAQVVARLPVGATFTYGTVEGPVAGPLTCAMWISIIRTSTSLQNACIWNRTCARCWGASCSWTRCRSAMPR